jgi:hypothetical protein
VVSGSFFSERLKAVSRIRVVNTNSFSKGGLAMEKVRVFSLGIRIRRVDEYHIGGLPRFEGEPGRLLEVKGYRPLRNFFPTYQLGLLICH